MSVTFSGTAVSGLASPNVGNDLADTEILSASSVTHPSRASAQASLSHASAFSDLTALGLSAPATLDSGAASLVNSLRPAEQALAVKVLAGVPENAQERIAESLVKLSQANLLSQRDQQGRGTLLEALATVATPQQLHRNAPDKVTLLSDMVRMAADPLQTAQGERPLCGPTEALRVALRQPPSDLAWMTAELATKGFTKLPSGVSLKIHAHLDNEAYTADAGIRPTVLMLSTSLMDLGQGSYNVKTGKSSGTINFDTVDAHGNPVTTSHTGDWAGMYPHDFQRQLQVTTGYKYQVIYSEVAQNGGAEALQKSLERVGNSAASIDELEKRFSEGKGVQSLAKWASGGAHLEHYLSILGTHHRDGKEYVVFSNPQGPSGATKEQTFTNTPGIELPNGLRLVERAQAEAMITGVFLKTGTKVDATTAFEVDRLPPSYGSVVQETLAYSPSGVLEVKSFLAPINPVGPEARGTTTTVEKTLPSTLMAEIESPQDDSTPARSVESAYEEERRIRLGITVPPEEKKWWETEDTLVSKADTKPSDQDKSSKFFSFASSIFDDVDRSKKP